jgi:DNA invertase Pin-like site-specific DNA recombinase
MKPSRAPTTGMTTALIYTRVSSDEQAREGVSLDAQLADCRRYATAQGWVLGGEYQDILSGTRDDRPQYQTLLDEVRRVRATGHQVAVLVAALDRFGRRLLERVRCREELKRLGVTVHSVREGEVNDLMANFLAVLAEEEVRRLGERVSAARQHLVRQGWYAPGRVPWGYRLREATAEERAAGAPKSVLEPDPVSAPYARELFSRAAQGESIRGLTRWTRQLPAPARGGRELNYSAVRFFLRMTVYIARQGSGETDVLSRPLQRWQALVDDSTWARAQALVSDQQRIPRQASGQYFLTGFARCPRCGARLNAYPRKDRRLNYRCSGETHGASRPDCRWYVPAATIEDQVKGEISRLLEAMLTHSAGMKGELQAAWQTFQGNEGNADDAQRVRDLEKMATKSRERLANAAALLVDGVLDRLGYEQLRDRELATLESIGAEVARSDTATRAPVLPALGDVLREIGGWSAALHDADVPALRNVMRVLIDGVVPRRDVQAKYSVEIAWTQAGQNLRAIMAARTVVAA